MSEPLITTEQQGHLLLIGANRPQKMNAFNAAMLHAFAEAYTELEDNPELRCGVVFAHGEHFSAGLDLADVAPRLKDSQGLLFDPELVDPWGMFGRTRKKPVVLAVQGRCYTLTIELALACDTVIAANNAQFTQLEVARGIMPFGGATLRFPQVAGWSNAMRYLLTGDFFDAEEAKRLGMVQEVVEPGKQLDRAIEIATTIAKQAPLAVQASRECALKGYQEGWDAGVAVLRPTVQRLSATADAQEGIRSFVERREANFTGQ